MNKEIYDALMNQTYDDSELEPFKELLSKITCFYNKQICGFNYFVRDNLQEEESNKKDFLEDLLPFFKKLINSKIDNANIDEVVSFLIKNKTPWNKFINHLYLVYFKEHLYNDKYYYYETVRDLCHFINFGLEPFSEDFNIFALLKYYQKYLNIVSEEDTKIWDRIIFFQRYAPLIIGIFYINNYPLNELDNILNKLVCEYEQVYSYFILNGADKKYTIIHDDNKEKQLIENFINNSKTPKKVLK